MRLAPMTALCLLVLLGSCERREGKSPSTKQAQNSASSSQPPDRGLERFRAGLDRFTLRVSFSPQRQVPAREVELAVWAPVGDQDRNTVHVLITQEEAERITTCLEHDGFFRRNEGSTYILHGTPEPPYYTLTVSAGPNTGYVEYFKAGPEAAARLDALIATLQHDAQQAMRRLTAPPSSEVAGG